MRCMSGYEIPEEACKDAGVLFGGKLINGKDMVIESTTDRSPGCYLNYINQNIVFNKNNNGINNGMSAPVCKTMSVSSQARFHILFLCMCVEIIFNHHY